MTKLSRVNVDVAVNTSSMDAGINQAKSKLNSFSQDLARVREGFGKVGLGAVGGFFSAQAFTAPLRAVESFVSSLESAASRAAQAIKNVEEGRGSFVGQGFTASGARFLAANEERIKAAAAGNVGLSFTQAAGESGILAAEAIGAGMRTVGGFAGSMFRQVVEGDMFTKGNPGARQVIDRLMDAASKAQGEAAVFGAPNDVLAQAIQIIQRQNERPNRELNKALEKLSNNGAPR